jgi:hypothetical protein
LNFHLSARARKLVVAAIVSCLVVTPVSSVTAAAAGALKGTAQSAAVAPSAVRRGTDGQSAYKLAAHNAGVRYDRDVRMWDCWDVGTRPRLSAWNGTRWVRWSMGAVSRDRIKCGRKANKVVFSYHVSLLGRPIRHRAYHLVRVKEHCPGCQTASWTLPVLPPGAAAD